MLFFCLIFFNKDCFLPKGDGSYKIIPTIFISSGSFLTRYFIFLARKKGSLSLIVTSLRISSIKSSTLTLKTIVLSKYKEYL